jgi:hypothetical protein
MRAKRAKIFGQGSNHRLADCCAALPRKLSGGDCPLAKAQSKEGWAVRLCCIAARQASIGENETGAALHRRVCGSQGVATGRNVVHKVNLAMAKVPKGGFKVVRVLRCRGQIAAVAGALGFDWFCAADSLCDLTKSHLTPSLSPCGEGDMAGDCACKDDVGACRAVTRGNGDKPARGFNKSSHFAGRTVEIGGWAARVLNRVCDASRLGFGSA